MDKFNNTGVSIAVVGMECFFPKSAGLTGFWRLIFQGEDAITDLPETHWSAADYYHEDPKKADHVYCKRGGFLDPVSFDPTTFGIPPAILEATDSSQLLALLAAKSALENAGYGIKGKTFDREKASVILGVTGTQELVIPLSSRLGHPVWKKALQEAGVDDDTIADVVARIGDAYVSWQENSFPGLLGNVVAGRISNRLDLGGTNCVIDAACASSLGAVHMATMELATGRSNLVVTGGVDTLNDIFMHMCFSKTSVLSPTGDARPFSADADGTVLGEGIGIVVLKRLSDAINDKDRIYAVIKGMGTASDGKSQSIYAPRAEGQIKAISTAYTQAGIDPASVELIEAHGTGTAVGDGVEFTALDRFFGTAAKQSALCPTPRVIGSVKSNIGHTKAAAGAAGLIKAVLALYHKVLPATLKAENPDPNLNIGQSLLYLNNASRPWLSRKAHPRRAGVSAFGFGGSNFHAVLEEHQPAKPEIAWNGAVDIFAFSRSSANELIAALKDTLKSLESADVFEKVACIAAALKNEFDHKLPYRLLMVVERQAFEQHKAAAVIAPIEGAIEQLTKNAASPVFENKATYFGGPGEPGKIAFMFPGQGAQYVGMGAELACTFPQALEALETANTLYSGKERLTDLIYPLPVSDRKEKKNQAADLTKTDVAQPAIGSISLAMLRIIRHFGLAPDATCGHSFGELVALNAAGWIDDETLLNLAVHRGHLMAAAGNADGDPGTMMAVKAPLEELDALIKGNDTGVILANRNSPVQGVLSGPTPAIENAASLCREKKFKTIPLTVAAAFHSHLMQDAQKPFMEIVDRSPMAPTQIPVFANSSGTPYPAEAENAKKILGGQLLNHVDFVNNVKNLYASGIRTFLEVGPKTVLTGLIRTILGRKEYNIIAMDASGGKESNLSDLARALCRLGALGFPVLLKQWQQGVVPPAGLVKPKMEIKISGANYRRPRADAGSSRAGNVPENKNHKPGGSSPAGSQTKPVMIQKADTMKDNHLFQGENPVEKTDANTALATNTETGHAPSGPGRSFPARGNELMTHALAVVQEGLKSMQALQQQTAQAHEKFLESQNRANQTLRDMMENTQRMLFNLPPAETPTATPDFPPDRPKPAPTVAEPAMAMPAATGIPEQDDSQTPAQAATETPAPPPPTAVPDHSRRINAVLLETVSELTGYPEEMLELDMDIESDLGIDSIKRVEILSTMEEKLPGLPPVEPDVMGSLKTLSQILQYLLPASGPSAATVDATVLTDDRAANPSGGDDVAAVLLETVSELTGYPEEMLELDMDIESDLGIDSIKRVEILSTMEEKLPGLPPVEPDVMGSLKTLSQILQYLLPEKTAPPQVPAVIEMKATIQPPPTETDASIESPVDRHVVSLVPTPLEKKTAIQPPSNKAVYIMESSTGISRALADAFISRGIAAEILPLDNTNATDITRVAGLVMPAPFSVSPEQDTTFLQKALMTAKHFAPALIETARQGRAFMAGISFMDGGFGFGSGAVQHPFSGGLAGLVKTAAIEWQGVLCRAFDLSPEWQNPAEVASAVADELIYADPASPVEVGLCPDNRYTLAVMPEAVRPGDLNLVEGDVVVITGGARGVTAAAACALAKKSPLKLFLIGRSPQPFDEPEWLKGIADEREMKKAIAANGFNDRKPTPKDIESAYRGFYANREILKNLAAIRSLGSTAVYCTADIRDNAAIAALLADIQKQHGPVAGVIHGAGVLEDKRIVDKTAEQFQTVFGTKVAGLLNLLDAVNPSNLKHLVLFSSVAARAGNKGQADYAMANEVLNKIARKKAGEMPHCRVLSINWGPWDGGMVSDALKKEFHKNHIRLIPIEAGARCLVAEMGLESDAQVEVVLGSMMPPENKTVASPADTAATEEACTPCPPTTQKLSIAFQRDIDTDGYPVLNSHVLGGKPVVPFALMAEWFGHGALHANPGLVLSGIDDMRVLKGIHVNSSTRKIRILAGKVRKNSNRYEVDVEIRNGIPDEQEVIHSRAKAILADALGQPPAFQAPAFMGSNGYGRSVDDIYEKILFHGEALRGMKEVVSLTDEGMIAKILPAPAPDKWMKQPLRNRWVGDPLVLDSAFQMASLWCFEKLGNVSLPVYCAAYRQYRDRYPNDLVTAVLEITEAADHKMKGNFTFLDADEAIVAQVMGFEAVVDESLNRAFKP